jgi:virginiamycin B lyase
MGFTESNANRMGRISVNGASFAEFALVTPGAGVSGISAGADGTLWFTESLAGRSGG